MKFIIEVDLDSPDHKTAFNLFVAVATLLKAMRGQIPPGARVQEVLERYPHEGHLVLAESAYDPTNSDDREYTITCPINMRVIVSDEPFDTKCRAAEDAKNASVGLGFKRIEADPKEVLGLQSHSTGSGYNPNDTLPGLKKTIQ
jgi:hypothetical protein